MKKKKEIINLEKYNQENPSAKVYVKHDNIKIDVYQWQMIIWLDPMEWLFYSKKITKEEAKKVILDAISEMSPLKDEIWEKIGPKIIRKNKRFLYVLYKGAEKYKKSCMYEIVE